MEFTKGYLIFKEEDLFQALGISGRDNRFIVEKINSDDLVKSPKLGPSHNITY